MDSPYVSSFEMQFYCVKIVSFYSNMTTVKSVDIRELALLSFHFMKSIEERYQA